MRKILITTSILPKEYTHLYGLVNQKELQENYIQIKSFYEKKEKELDNYNISKYALFLKELQDKYGSENILIVNQEIDRIFEKENIKFINLHGSIKNRRCGSCYNYKENKSVPCVECNSEKEIPDITLKDEEGLYPTFIDYINKSHLYIQLGNVGQADPSLFLDEMLYSVYINKEREKHTGMKIEDIEKTDERKYVDQFFSHTIINKENELTELSSIIEHFMSKKEFIIDIDNPFTNLEDEINININNMILDKKEKIDLKYKSDIYEDLIILYPFLKKYDEIVVEYLWNTFCFDTGNINKMDIPFYDKFFYDMFLVYTYYRWNIIKKKDIKKQKISLLEATHNNDQFAISLFKRLITKGNDMDSKIENIKNY